MSKIVQEKFEQEFSIPYEDGSNYWATDKSARVKKGSPGREAYRGDVSSIRQSTNRNFNSLPPGQDIEDQEMADIRSQPEYMAGATDVSYDCPTPAVSHRGFFRKTMKPTDDLYTNEHVDLFYGEVRVEVEDGNFETGFLERGNLLDRM